MSLNSSKLELTLWEFPDVLVFRTRVPQSHAIATSTTQVEIRKESVTPEKCRKTCAGKRQ